MHPDERGSKVGSEFVEETINKIEHGHFPYLTTDGYRVYNEAIEHVYGEWTKKS